MMALSKHQMLAGITQILSLKVKEILLLFIALVVSQVDILSLYQQLLLMDQFVSTMV
jgi:hypothetical protein